MAARSWVYPYSWDDDEIVHVTERTVIVTSTWCDPAGERPSLFGVEEDWAGDGVRGIVVGADGVRYISEDDGLTGSEVMAIHEREA